jgi:Mg-chelatase subunit ChlI
MPVT